MKQVLFPPFHRRSEEQRVQAFNPTLLYPEKAEAGLAPRQFISTLLLTPQLLNNLHPAIHWQQQCHHHIILEVIVVLFFELVFIVVVGYGLFPVPLRVIQTRKKKEKRFLFLFFFFLLFCFLSFPFLFFLLFSPCFLFSFSFCFCFCFALFQHKHDVAWVIYLTFLGLSFLMFKTQSVISTCHILVRM